MELRHLRYFMAVAEELHFGKAAAKLHIAQPPLSQQIQKLETELGFQLFERTKRQVNLTEAGKAFLLETQQIFQKLEQAISTGQKISRGEQGELSIAFVSSAAYNVIPSILRKFRTLAPGVKLQLKELTTKEQLKWLREERLDIGFVRPPVDKPEFNSQIVLWETLVVALPANHSLADRENISCQSLAEESFILFPRNLAPELFDRIISLCQQANFCPQIVQEATQMQTIVSLVSAEIGIAIVPESIQNLQRTGVVYKSLIEATPQPAIAVVWRKEERSTTVAKFIDLSLLHHSPRILI
ncbi:MAG: LysR family transcriptional regulator [Xenococcaceae cyanobacterium MO_188.B29]|nr:LysR family transcriptional regulator [Xenococcaceae cyanobacterium MO_188.B29]